MSARIKLLLNTVTLLIALVVNYLSNTGIFNSKTIGEVSKKYNTLFTPAGYAFSIWGLIYLLLISFVAYQWYFWLKERKDEVIHRIGGWFMLANIANASWVVAWIYEYTGLSVLIMLVLLVSLIQIVRRLDLERWDAPLDIILFVWWPICIYIGWIILATVANISAFLISLGWKGGTLLEESWTIVLILISTFIYTVLIYIRNMREAALVGVWGLVAIAYRQWNEQPEIVYAALLNAFVLLSYASYHGYKNRAYSPLAKWKNRNK